jgi:uncharacterized protein YbjT (DUF2867 family)
MTNKTYVVTGAAGAVGKVVAERLEAQGYQVRRVSRRDGVSFDDARTLMRAFSGVAGAFLMIPFDMQASDLHQREDEIGSKLAEAVKQAGVQRVVLLSGTSAHLKEEAGSGQGAAMMEERLAGLDIAELVSLRAAFFMENHFNFGLIEQARTGVYGTLFRPDIAMPMIAARDVGQTAAQWLVEEPFRQPRVRELLGAGDYTMIEATRILGSAIGKPALKYVHISYEEAYQAMLSRGLSPSFISAVIQTARSINTDTVWAREQRSAHNTTETTLEEFAQQVFRKVYQETTK